MNLAEVKKLKVADLRAELQQRGLDTKGLKADLVERLMSAIEAESQSLESSEVGENEGPVGGNEVKLLQGDSLLELSAPVVETANEPARHLAKGTAEVNQFSKTELISQGLTQPCGPTTAGFGTSKQPNFNDAAKAVEIFGEYPDEVALNPEQNATAALEETLAVSNISRLVRTEAAIAAKPVVKKASPPATTEEPRGEGSIGLQSTCTLLEADLKHKQKNSAELKNFEDHFSPAPGPGATVASAYAETREETLTTDKSMEPANTDETTHTVDISPQTREEIKKDDVNGGTEKKKHTGSTGDDAETDWSLVAERGSDDEAGDGLETEGDQQKEDSVSRGSDAERKDREQECRGVKRPYGERGRGYYEFKEEINYNRAKSPDPEPEAKGEEEVDEGLVRLDSYNSDLHFEVGRDGCSGQPLLSEKFPLLWSGCRLTHGVDRGKVGFEAKFVKKLPVTELKADDPDTHILRVGWSVDDSSFQLGEVAFSYCYDGRGRKVTEGNEEDFGEHFSEGDVIGCYALFSDEEVELSFHKNGCPLGVAFRVGGADLAGHALYPHVLCRNCSVMLNLDPVGPPWHPSPAEYTPLSALPAEARVRAPLPPATKQDCEVLMMVGMPGAGKTHWAQAHIAQNPEKRYNLLGTRTVLGSMKCVPSPGQKEQIFQQATQCLSQLIKLAAQRRRNYILDQANVYSSAQRRKLLRFGGFRRRAVVVCPSDEEWKRRLQMHQQEEGEEVPEMSLLKVKVSFSLPLPGDHLDEVLFPELSRDETEKLLASYKEEARRLLPSPPKRKKPRLRRNKPPPNVPGHPGRNHRDWGHGWNRGGYHQQPYGNQPYWGPQRREDYRQHNQYRTEHDRFYGRSYDPQRYRDYYRQYTGEWNPYYQDQGHYGNRNYGYSSNRGGYW